MRFYRSDSSGESNSKAGVRFPAHLEPQQSFCKFGIDQPLQDELPDCGRKGLSESNMKLIVFLKFVNDKQAARSSLSDSE